MKNTLIEYLPDNTIDANTDQQLRNLFTTCFTGAHDVIFKTQRYFAEPYPHRWIIRSEQGTIVAHTGVHDKIVKTIDTTLRIGGIAEVSVHPDHRGKGYVKAMFKEAHTWLKNAQFDFAVLFGNPEVYSSSGYTETPNFFVIPTPGQKPEQKTAMYCSLQGKSWPTSQVILNGPAF